MSHLLILLALVTGHVLADFYLQSGPASESYSERRHAGSLARQLLTRPVINTLIMLLVLLGGGTGYQLLLWPAVLAFGALLCAELIRSRFEPRLWLFICDQALQLLVLGAAWFYVTGQTLSGLTQWLQTGLTSELLVVLLAFLLCAKPVSVLISLLLGRWSQDIAAEEQARQQAAADKARAEALAARPRRLFSHNFQQSNGYKNSQAESAVTLQSAGAFIGYLERGLILAFVLVGYHAGVGLIVAAKSVFRFGDLKDSHSRKFTEYVIIGTFTSMASALAIGLVASRLIGN